MKAIKKFFIILLLLVVLTGAAYVYGGVKTKKELERERKVITSQVILDKIQDQYFLVTKTLLWNDMVEVVLESSNGWKDFFVGDQLKAQGTVRVDIGVDLNNFNVNDIIIDHVNKNVVVYFPKAEILDASLKDDIDVESKKGIWTNIKDFFVGERNEDYNRAAHELIAAAEDATKRQQDIFIEAREAGIKLIQLIIDSYLSGYVLEVKQK